MKFEYLGKERRFSLHFQRIGLGNDEVTENKGGAKKLSEYNKFVKREFKKCQKDYPSKKAPEIMKIVAKKWKSSKKH